MSAKVEVIVEYIYRDAEDGYWLDVVADGSPYAQMGPFKTKGVRDRAKEDLLETMRSMGASDLPIYRQ